MQPQPLPLAFIIVLGLIGNKILRKPIHHFVDRLVEGILLHDAPLVAPPFLVAIPGEPGHGVEPIALEDVAAVQGAVVVDEQDVAGLHGQGGDVLFARARFS